MEKVELAYLALRAGTLEMALRAVETATPSDEACPFSQAPPQVDSCRTYRPTEVVR